ncbi:helix-turn-helix domain-containing protein [Listeria marthii]|uniref:helix-turn-helix domain-containing protein n=1 Tax=Listeria marthii TaxID=529731 RepID=UPI001629F635|nr:helix-turn-helix domain-containing protein [Listeria marthii]MBC2039968.1 helix-turn-helix domain-containing protein [Listeria marthii]
MSQELALKVKIKLLENNLTMTKLAKELGLSTVYLSDIINGKKSGPKAQEHIVKIKQILEIK